MSKIAVGPQMPFFSSAGGAVVRAGGGAVVSGAAIAEGAVVSGSIVVTVRTCPEIPNTLRPGETAE